jgi:hypothetical protein
MARATRLLFLFAMIAGSHAAIAAPSCTHTVGANRANQYVRQCFMVMQSVHWPCNAKNSCDDIVNAIRKGCSDIHSSLDRHPEWATPGPGRRHGLIEPAFCSAYRIQP